MRLRLLIFVLAMPLWGCQSSKPAAEGPERQAVTPAYMQAVSDDLQFSQAVRVGETIWVSGQVGYGAQGIPASVAEQTRLAFENLSAVLAEAGASLSDVVMLRTYHTSMQDFPAFAEVKAEYIKAPFPAWTAVEVSALAEPSLRIEIEAVAVVSSADTP